MLCPWRPRFGLYSKHIRINIFLVAKENRFAEEEKGGRNMGQFSFFFSEERNTVKVIAWIDSVSKKVISLFLERQKRFSKSFKLKSK